MINKVSECTKCLSIIWDVKNKRCLSACTSTRELRLFLRPALCLREYVISASPNVGYLRAYNMRNFVASLYRTNWEGSRRLSINPSIRPGISLRAGPIGPTEVPPFKVSLIYITSLHEFPVEKICQKTQRLINVIWCCVIRLWLSDLSCFGRGAYELDIKSCLATSFVYNTKAHSCCLNIYVN